MTIQSLLQHPELFKIDLQPGEFNSGLVAVKHFKAGHVITRLTGTTPTTKSWSSVQCGKKPDDHIELNSVLVYVNHSCSPNAAFDLSSPNKEKWNFRALRDIQPGEELTFFYPSTEWDMDQGFKCRCQAENCLGFIRGAKELGRDQIAGRGFVSTYISQLLDERDTNTSSHPNI